MELLRRGLTRLIENAGLNNTSNRPNGVAWKNEEAGRPAPGGIYSRSRRFSVLLLVRSFSSSVFFVVH